MLESIKIFFSKVMFEQKKSIGITDTQLIKSFIDDPDFPFLISFPRTGSHWLRMLMELYFQKPYLTRAFYYKKSLEFTCFHTHDLDMDIYRNNVIYLYREPISTIFSQLSYYDENLKDGSRVNYWSEKYALHLSKWLIQEQKSKKKIVVNYERLKTNLPNEFQNITDYYGEKLDQTKLLSASTKITKEEVKKKTNHDQKVINLSLEYESRRHFFEVTYKDKILDKIYKIDPQLQFYFS